MNTESPTPSVGKVFLVKEAGIVKSVIEKEEKGQYKSL
jgi:hypothetical protein